jgi:hypothetical protein
MTDATTLIVTANDDTTADLVADALTSRGGKVVPIDVGDFPITLSVTGTIGGDGVWRGELVTADSTVLDLESIDAVYYRRPTRFRLPDHLSPADRRFAEAEAHRGLGGLLVALPTRWVSHPARIADAEAKPVQLQLAAACGFRLPRTLISNDPDRVREFASDIAAIHTADPEQLDWRSDCDTVTYQHVELPVGVAAGIHRYLAAAGLAFGAFDFVMDQAGALWWMECNPNGEWGWLTECVDVPIADALAELLLGASAR